MNVTKEIIEFAERIRTYRIDTKLIEELRIKNEALEKQLKEVEESIKILKLNAIDQNKLLEQITVLEETNRRLKLDLENAKRAYTFIVTTPNKASNTVYGEISNELAKAQETILICSPWIAYVIDELSRFKKKDGKKKINLKIITRLIKEDFEKGVTDLDKIRILKDNFGADIRYNNELHAKMVVIDSSIAIISSANLTKKGLHANYEAGVCLRDRNIVDEVVQFFNKIWDESKPLTEQEIENVSSN